jgi:hypothetical protein
MRLERIYHPMDLQQCPVYILDRVIFEMSLSPSGKRDVQVSRHARALVTVRGPTALYQYLQFDSVLDLIPLIRSTRIFTRVEYEPDGTIIRHQFFLLARSDAMHMHALRFHFGLMSYSPIKTLLNVWRYKLDRPRAHVRRHARLLLPILLRL